MTVLIDSWAWIEYFKGTSQGQKAKKYVEGEEEIIVSSINITEVYTFLLRNKSEEASKLIEFLFQTSFVVALDTEIALIAAKNKYEKKFGIADAIVLATAKQHNAKIVTGDDDFKKENNVIYMGDS